MFGEWQPRAERVAEFEAEEARAAADLDDLAARQWADEREAS